MFSGRIYTPSVIRAQGWGRGPGGERWAEIATPEGGTGAHQFRAGFNTKIICNHRQLELKIRIVLSRDFVSLSRETQH